MEKKDSRRYMTAIHAYNNYGVYYRVERLPSGKSKETGPYIISQRDFYNGAVGYKNGQFYMQKIPGFTRVKLGYRAVQDSRGPDQITGFPTKKFTIMDPGYKALYSQSIDKQNELKALKAERKLAIKNREEVYSRHGLLANQRQTPTGPPNAIERLRNSIQNAFGKKGFVEIPSKLEQAKKDLAAAESKMVASFMVGPSAQGAYIPFQKNFRLDVYKFAHSDKGISYLGVENRSLGTVVPQDPKDGLDPTTGEKGFYAAINFFNKLLEHGAVQSGDNKNRQEFWSGTNYLAGKSERPNYKYMVIDSKGKEPQVTQQFFWLTKAERQADKSPQNAREVSFQEWAEQKGLTVIGVFTNGDLKGRSDIKFDALNGFYHRLNDKGLILAPYAGGVGLDQKTGRIAAVYDRDDMWLVNFAFKMEITPEQFNDINQMSEEKRVHELGVVKTEMVNGEYFEWVLSRPEDRGSLAVRQVEDGKLTDNDLLLTFFTDFGPEVSKAGIHQSIAFYTYLRGLTQGMAIYPDENDSWRPGNVGLKPFFIGSRETDHPVLEQLNSQMENADDSAVEQMIEKDYDAAKTTLFWLNDVEAFLKTRPGFRNFETDVPTAKQNYWVHPETGKMSFVIGRDAVQSALKELPKLQGEAKKDLAEKIKFAQDKGFAQVNPRISAYDKEWSLFDKFKKNLEIKAFHEKDPVKRKELNIQFQRAARELAWKDERGFRHALMPGYPDALYRFQTLYKSKKWD